MTDYKKIGNTALSIFLIGFLSWVGWNYYVYKTWSVEGTLTTLDGTAYSGRIHWVSAYRQDYYVELDNGVRHLILGENVALFSK